MAEHKLDEQSSQAQKMESVGRLASGVAHDFNNLLTVILSHCDELRSHQELPAPVRDGLEEIASAAARAAELTQQLLAFSRQQALAPDAIQVNAVVSESQRLLRRLIGEDIVLRVLLTPDLECVHIDRAQLEQVIVNLVVNARDALAAGGTITLKTQSMVVNEPCSGLEPGPSVGQYTLLSVSDTGHGMDAETQQHIFEPFFTTKEPGKGTGLGLSTVQSIVRQNAGYIDVSSELGCGTTFKVFFPALPGAVHDITPRVTQPRAAGGNETILLVEDEDRVRVLMASVLRRHGYRVIEAHAPIQAIELSKQYTSTIHLLLTDVVMPEMSGPELAEMLQPYRQSTRVLYVSGYTDYTLKRHGVCDRSDAFLPKPLTPERLLRKVRDVLDASAAVSSAARAP
jgi:nitrogen-specific signal transduction histidine kinase/ActR/RegA family two-component response regulator